MKFETDPPGATVTVSSDGEEERTYTTPTTIELRRANAQRVVITKEGYQPVAFVLTPNWDGASLPGFVLPGGSISVAADRASGADLAFYPIPKITLPPATRPTAGPVMLRQFRGQLLSEEEYKRAVEEEERYLREMRQH
jgi:hypothetical protein